VFVAEARLANFDFKSGTPLLKGGSGKGRDLETATRSAIAEGMERYCSYRGDVALVRASYRDVADRAMAPQRFVLHSAEQYATAGFVYRAPDDATEIAWVEGRRFDSGSEVLLPASMVFLSHAHVAWWEMAAMATSNGLGAGATLDDALLSGLCEVIERDAFLLAWLFRQTPPAIDPDSWPGWVRSVARQYGYFGIELSVRVLESDTGVPVMMSLALDRDPGGIGATIGLACHPDPQVALEKSVLELCQARAIIQLNQRMRSPRARLRSHDDVRSLEDHCLYYSLPEHRDEVLFFVSSAEKVALERIPSAPASAREIAARLAARGIECAYVDLTTADLEEYLRVVRVMATDLVPITFGVGMERLESRRVREAAERFGVPVAEMNRAPHPMS
jgi:ribosomal protein S12 methylthiotransferase accessory factor